jgi:hypothetical protein
MRLRVTFIALSALVLVDARLAAADDAGEAGTNGDSDVATSDATSGDDGSANNDPGPDGTPIACDGALCDTTNGSECGVAGPAIGNAHLDSTSVGALVAVLGLGIARRARRGALRPPLCSEPR